MKRLICASRITVALVPVAACHCASITKAATAQPNAYDFYLRAGTFLNYKGQGTDFPDFNSAKLNAPFRSAWTRREAVLVRNTRALSLMRQGFAYKYSPPARKSIWDAVRYPLFPQTRQFARLLGVEAEVYAHRGEYAKSISWAHAHHSRTQRHRRDTPGQRHFAWNSHRFVDRMRHRQHRTKPDYKIDN